MTSATILPFPSLKKGRVRRAGSMDAAGECSLAILQRDGEAAPANVVRYRDHCEPPELPTLTPDTALFATIYSVLSAGQQLDCKALLKRWAKAGHREAELAHSLLSIATATCD